MRAISPIATLLCSCLLSLQALAQVPAEPAPPLATPAASAAPAAVPASRLTREDLEAWLDGFMGFALERGNFAGAVVVVVKDGQVLLQRGYGYSDVEKRTPVDPETTLFRPGSVSKLREPPCRTTIERAIASPWPVPRPTSFVVKNGSKTRSAISGAIPVPVSRTDNTT
jgi:hypothetical protein